MKDSISHDLLASVVVFLVALPLCMGIAMASGVPPAAGLITGIVGGIVVGALAGSPLQVSGPAAGLAVIVLDIVTRFGLAGLGPIVLLAGALQLAAGLAKQGRWFRAVSPAVVHGMLGGIGVLILVSQVHVMLDARPPGTGLRNLLGIPGAVYDGVASDGPQHRQAAGVGILTLVALAGWAYLPWKKLRAVPAALAAVVVGSLVANLAGLEVQYVRVPDRLWDAVAFPTADAFALLLRQDVLLVSVGLAAVASAESLLCAGAVDQLHDGPRTGYDRELAAQGIGNMICGALGALPLTGVIVRSSANVQAGGRTRLSAILHGVWIAVLVVVFPQILQRIPTSCLAAVLVYTGFKLAHPSNAQSVQRFGRGELLVYAVTLTTIVAVDLLIGVLAGVGLAFVRLIRSSSRLNIAAGRVPIGGEALEHCIQLEGAATFVTLPRLASVLEAVPVDEPVHVHTAGLTYIDSSCLDLIIRFEKRHRERGTHVSVEDWDELWSKYHVGRHDPQLRPQELMCPGLPQQLTPATALSNGPSSSDPSEGAQAGASA